MSSLGKELREERERRAVSLKDISAQTKVGLWMLEALENDRLDLLPGPFFIRGMIRLYAGTIGADEKPFLERYRADSAPRPEPSVPAPAAPVRRRGRPWLWAALPLGLAAAVFAVVSTRSRTDRPAMTTLARPMAVETAALTGPPRIDPPKAPLRLEISFTEDTWLQVLVDGIMVLDGVRTAGQTAQFTGRDKIVIHTGNAGGFTFRLNDKPGKRLGVPGEVVKDVGITPQNLTAYLLPPEIAAEGSGGVPR